MTTWWTDFQRTGGEPWKWWFERHQVKLFLACALFVVVF